MGGVPHFDAKKVFWHIRFLFVVFFLSSCRYVQNVPSKDVYYSILIYFIHSSNTFSVPFAFSPVVFRNFESCVFFSGLQCSTFNKCDYGHQPAEVRLEDMRRVPSRTKIVDRIPVLQLP